MGEPWDQLGGLQSQLGGLQSQLGGPLSQLGGPQSQLGGPQSQLREPRSQLGGPQSQGEGPWGGTEKKEKKKNRAFTVCGGTIGHRPLRGRCPKSKTMTMYEHFFLTDHLK